MGQTKEEKREYNRIRYHMLKDTHIKQYRTSDSWIKSNRISNWKHSGMIEGEWNGIPYTYDDIYELYLSTDNCDFCHRQLTYDKKTSSTTKQMDHDHETGLFRNIICNRCNSQMKHR